MADAAPAHYSGFGSDSARWEGFAFRPGDIVISTPSKCGTTLTQMLCALLVFDGPDFPGPLSEISPWLDQTTHRLDDILATLDAQTHRRFIKTHTPLDGLVIDDRVTYLGIGRDPRDAAVSLVHHRMNLDYERYLHLRIAAVGMEGVGDRATRPEITLDGLDDHLRRWIDDPTPCTDDPESLASILHHFDTFWARRDQENVARFHFADYRRDLAGELARMADLLGYPYSPDRIEALAAEASIDKMRARAVEVAPNANQQLWKDTSRFFRSGGGGEWRDLFTADDERHYDERVAQLVAPEVAAWAHGGRRASYT